MKVKVTALKAPWPEGTKIGDTVTVTATPKGEVPAWALGKCDVIEEASDEEVDASKKAADEKAAADAAAEEDRLAEIAAQGKANQQQKSAAGKTNKTN